MECSICFEDETRGKIIITNCDHAFHRNCILEWLRHTPCFTCPICRRPMDYVKSNIENS